MKHQNWLNQSLVLSTADHPHLAWSTLPWSLLMDRFLNSRTAMQSTPRDTTITWQDEYAPFLTFSAVVGKIYPSPTLICSKDSFSFPAAVPDRAYAPNASLCLTCPRLAGSHALFRFPRPTKNVIRQRNEWRQTSPITRHIHCSPAH